MKSKSEAGGSSCATVCSKIHFVFTFKEQELRACCVLNNVSGVLHHLNCYKRLRPSLNIQYIPIKKKDNKKNNQWFILVPDALFFPSRKSFELVFFREVVAACSCVWRRLVDFLWLTKGEWLQDVPPLFLISPFHPPPPPPDSRIPHRELIFPTQPGKNQVSDPPPRPPPSALGHLTPTRLLSPPPTLLFQMTSSAAAVFPQMRDASLFHLLFGSSVALTVWQGLFSASGNSSCAKVAAGKAAHTASA